MNKIEKYLGEVEVIDITKIEKTKEKFINSLKFS